MIARWQPNTKGKTTYLVIRRCNTRTRRQIDLMNEYRTRLTADVVTGQLDVREAAEELPTPEPTEITD